jgi:hypothetical protein
MESRNAKQKERSDTTSDGNSPKKAKGQETSSTESLTKNKGNSGADSANIESPNNKAKSAGAMDARGTKDKSKHESRDSVSGVTEGFANLEQRGQTGDDEKQQRGQTDDYNKQRDQNMEEESEQQGKASLGDTVAQV